MGSGGENRERNRFHRFLIGVGLFPAILLSLLVGEDRSGRLGWTGFQFCGHAWLVSMLNTHFPMQTMSNVQGTRDTAWVECSQWWCSAMVVGSNVCHFRG
jgi:hypothetical protein